ncbi:2-succinyl-5-enolpyruvyl-6-hydroxy-3-cyclohexene-1-carboxylic-acid synthase [Capillimicrobium parvum]|uniref:2-succinyl-5-enolpyruvyl-6-hydroxy-3-cyclohexene-1-carboxylate synthase n=1 Tax=Capillimicrobium parvum TaxID=2884022 RepID=A0A9E7C162_9ACTN|nr:2-succinyl-5-enolpyruvyl-6-hydroxy-3-cyclohexene-1-carboxylic-acid synthase [Capillimicrobium parvum]UGS36252.1 2-succinyl-5-enolpyruvyl-6-hydroxy-3-cyclohexene-1-carboxylate synthase [Capillimicrobium parvum]
MTPTADSYLLLRAFVDELVRCGATDACTSPGSRSTPLVLSLVRDGRLRCHSHVDERASAFFALGLAKATRRPVPIACTSGTAAAEYLPAVIEAHEAGVPLVVLTADRPPELRDVGAGQTVDQIKLYGSAVRWFVDLGIHDATPTRLRWARSLACRVMWAASGASGRPGPVHVNVPLREPLVLDAPLGPDPRPGRPAGVPWLARPAAAPASSAQALTGALTGARRPLVVAGRAEHDPALAGALAAFAAAAGAPLLADPLSDARRGAHAVAHYDALLRVPGFGDTHRPDLVVRAGDLPTSKPLRRWLAGLGERVVQVALDPEAVWSDPDGVLSAALPGDPAATLEEAARAAADRPAAAGTPPIHAAGRPPASEWLDGWREADRAAGAAIAAALGAGALNEPLIARTVAGGLGAEHVLFVASSMPVRDVETFAAVRADGPRVLCNRGANGIDGTVASALGVAATGTATTLLIGDVALAYDHSALLAIPRLGLDVTIVLVDNGGGGIFDFLPVSGETDAYEEHVATPTGLAPRRIAALYGLEYERVKDAAGLTAALGRPGARLLHAPTDRAGNVALHRRVWAAVEDAVA